MRNVVAVVCALGMSTAVAADDAKRSAVPSLENNRWDIAMTLGIHREREGKYAEAESFYREAVHVGEGLEKGSTRLTAALSALAANYDNLGRFSDAERLYRRAMRLIAESQGRRSADYATVETNLAASFTHRGEPLKGESLLTEAIGALEAIEPPDDERLALARDGLGAVLLARHRFAEAADLFLQVLDTFRKTPQSWQCRTAIAMNNLAVVRGYQGRREEAVQLLQQSLTEGEDALGRDHPLLLRTLNNLALAHAAVGHFEEADAVSRRAVSLAEKRLGREHPLYGEVLANYAVVLRKNGRKSEAKTLEAEARTVLRDSARANGHGMTVDVSSFR